MCESSHGAQGLDALEEEGGAVQGLPITGVLDWTAVTGKKTHIVKHKKTSQRVCVMSHPPTESQGSEETSSLGWVEFQGS